METKTTMGVSQFFSQNTPKIAQKIGDISLICAGTAMAIWGLPIAMQEAGIANFVLPLFLVKIAKICAAAGVLGKIITKLMGKTDEKGNAVPTAQQ